MANLFWKTGKGTRALLDKPFSSEDEFERMVFTTSELLKDIFLLQRQIRGGNKPGIPDILGIDREGNVCIVEMKNTEVDANIIPQVLHYAFWAETNPDSVKSLWLECSDKPDDIEINWDDLGVRILVIAPSIHRSTLDLVNRITYPVELIEVKRWVEGQNAFLFVNKLEPDAVINRRRPVSGARTYDADALRASIGVHNHLRRLVRDLYALRQATPWKVPTSELYVMLRATVVLPVEDAIVLLQEYRAGVEAADDRLPLDQARVLLTGSFCEQPPLGLIRTLERAGCYIVDDDFVQIHRWIKSDIPTDGDPLDNLVQAFLSDSIASPTRYIDRGVKGAELIERVRTSGAEGVLFCAPSFCDPALLDQPMAVRAVEQTQVPWTAFKYSENTGQFQVIREQAGTFADSIRLWSQA